MSEPSEPVCHDKLCARQCEDISLKWAGAAPPPLRVVCDEYLPKCHRLSAGVKAIAAMARQWCTDPQLFFRIQMDSDQLFWACDFERFGAIPI